MENIKTDFNKAFKEVRDLAKTFKEGESYYLSSKYQEAEARQDFIDDFFIALGWDVRHKYQKNPHKQEVKIEKTVEQKERSKKKADYAFSLAPDFNIPVFFVEAKKSARDLLNADDYYQAINYGWHEQTPIVVLTDFEEFHIIDSRYDTTIDTALNRKVKEFRYTDYTDEKKFAEIYWLFSREAVADGSIADFAEKLPTPKTKDGKSYTPRGTKSIDEALLDELEKVREILAKAFKKNNPSLDSEQLTEATQKTIDRLVFFRFLTDKTLEPDNYLKRYIDNQNPWKDFGADSNRLDQKYNGALFKHNLIDEKTFKAPSDNDFKQVCSILANPAYNFSYIGIHILGSIYERFLGKVVKATAKQVSIETKPEIENVVKKAGGVFYTPQYIVSHIVENTIGKLVADKSPKQISAMKFVDPSCGSGSFILTVYNYLLEYHSQWYNDNTNKARTEGCIYIKEDDRWVLTLDQKRKILVNNIFGVDIDEQAVEVTQLSLYLKLLEDETMATAHQMSAMFSLLPDLSDNIVCGNSIVETDVLSLILTDDEIEKLNPMDWKYTFPEIFDKGGFDAVVGNPPWISLSRRFKNEIMSKAVIEYLIGKYSGDTSSPNVYEYFVKRGLEITKTEGYFSFIVPDRLGYNDQFVALRKRIVEDFTIEELIYKAPFPNITTDTLIFRFQNQKRKSYKIKVGEHSQKPIIKTKKDYLQDAKHQYSYEGSQQITALLDKLFANNNCQPLGQIVTSKTGIILNTKAITDSRQNNKQTELYRGRSIYAYETTESYFIDLIPANVKGGTQDPVKLSAKEKTLVRKTGFPIYATYNDTGVYPEQSLYFLINCTVNLSLKYLCALINSHLFQFVYWNRLVTNRDSTPQLKKTDLDKFPVLILDQTKKQEKSKNNKICKLVDQAMDTVHKWNQAKTTKQENMYERLFNTTVGQINDEVYKLYDLTATDIKEIKVFAKDKGLN